MSITEVATDTIHVPARDIRTPAYLSPIAQAYLKPQPASPPYPAIADKAGWRAYVNAVDQAVPRFSTSCPKVPTPPIAALYSKCMAAG